MCADALGQAFGILVRRGLGLDFLGPHPRALADQVRPAFVYLLPEALGPQAHRVLQQPREPLADVGLRRGRFLWI